MYVNQIIMLYTLNLYSAVCHYISIKLKEKNILKTEYDRIKHNNYPDYSINLWVRAIQLNIKTSVECLSCTRHWARSRVIKINVAWPWPKGTYSLEVSISFDADRCTMFSAGEHSRSLLGGADGWVRVSQEKPA